MIKYNTDAVKVPKHFYVPLKQFMFLFRHFQGMTYIHILLSSVRVVHDLTGWLRPSLGPALAGVRVAGRHALSHAPAQSHGSILRILHARERAAQHSGRGILGSSAPAPFNFTLGWARVACRAEHEMKCGHFVLIFFCIQ